MNTLAYLLLVLYVDNNANVMGVQQRRGRQAQEKATARYQLMRMAESTIHGIHGSYLHTPLVYLRLALLRVPFLSSTSPSSPSTSPSSNKFRPGVTELLRPLGLCGRLAEAARPAGPLGARGALGAVGIEGDVRPLGRCGKACEEERAEGAVGVLRLPPLFLVGGEGWNGSAVADNLCSVSTVSSSPAPGDCASTSIDSSVVSAVASVGSFINFTSSKAGIMLEKVSTRRWTSSRYAA